MKLVDANTLIYAVDESAVHHQAAVTWLDGAMNSHETVLLPWVSLLAFVRITTQPRLLDHPLPTSTATEIVAEWLRRPNTLAPEPDSRHLARLTEILAATGGRGGNLVNDAHLAALAIQYDATVITFDSDFGRFAGVRWTTPLD